MYYPFKLYSFRGTAFLLWAVVCVPFFLVTAPSFSFAQSDERVAGEYRSRGLQAQNNGRIKEALFYYQQASALLPDDASLKNDVALMQDNLGQNEEAQENYRQALALDPQYLPVYFNMGRFYAKQGLYPLAAKYLKERISRGSADDPFTLQAQEELETVYNAVPALQAEHLSRQAMVLTDMITEGKKRLQKRVGKDTTTSFEAAYQQGIAAFVDKRFDDAVEALETAVVLNPRSIDARHALQRARLENDRGYLQLESRDYRQRLKERALERYLGPLPQEEARVPSLDDQPFVGAQKRDGKTRTRREEGSSRNNRGYIISTAVDEAEQPSSLQAAE